MIKIFMDGRVATEPQVNQTKNGGKSAQFNLAGDTNRKDAAGQKISNFFRVTVWGSTAEFVEKFVTKGMKVSVTGDFAQTEFISKKTGEKMTSLEINNADVSAFFPPKTDGGQQNAKPQRQQAPRHAYDDEEPASDDDSLPF